MKSSALHSRLGSYRNTIPSGKASDWAERTKTWSSFAAVTGSALAMASSASATVVYSGPIDLTVHVASVPGPGHGARSPAAPAPQ